jgi:hypothetical protein
VSSLWTPEGEHRVARPTPAGPDGGPAPTGPPGSGGPGGGDRGGAGPADDGRELSPDEQRAMAERLDELRAQLLATPAEVVVANHVYGLFELAALHLSEQPPRLDQARLAVDAMGAVVESLAGRLGEAEGSLLEALAQIRLAYVQISGAVDAPAGGGAPVGGDAPAGGGAADGDGRTEVSPGS